MQQKKYNDKRRLDGCNILEAANVVRLASHHHRPENKVQSGNDLIYLVLAPKIIIFLITHFEKRGLAIKGVFFLHNMGRISKATGTHGFCIDFPQCRRDDNWVDCDTLVQVA